MDKKIIFAQPQLSIIILNWNGKEFLQDCLASVFNQTYDNFKVILVDNHSTDDSVSFVRENFPKAEIIELNENYGFAKGNNIGIKYALEKHNAEYIFLLNNDTKIVQNGALKKLIEIAESDRKIGILGCKLIYPDGQIQSVGMTLDLLSPVGLKHIVALKGIAQKAGDVYAVMGAVFLFKRAVINKIGFFDEGFSPLYYEETDYCVRARKAGFFVKVAYQVEIIHHCKGSSKKKPKSYLGFILRTNGIRFVLLNFPLSLLIVKIFYEGYWIFKNLPASVLERKSKNAGLSIANLKIRQEWRDRLSFIFTPYLTNIKNLNDIIYKRIFRTKNLSMGA